MKQPQNIQLQWCSRNEILLILGLPLGCNKLTLPCQKSVICLYPVYVRLHSWLNSNICGHELDQGQGNML